jgi:hypothetical protein
LKEIALIAILYQIISRKSGKYALFLNPPFSIPINIKKRKKEKVKNNELDIGVSNNTLCDTGSE